MNDLSLAVARGITKLTIISTFIFVILKISGIGNWKHWDWKFAFYPIIFWVGFLVTVTAVRILYILISHGLMTHVIPFLDKKINRKPIVITSIFGENQ
jgi:hypothetical protein